MARSGSHARPPVPPITEEGSVINWFLAYDEQLNGLRANFPDQIAEVAMDIQGVLIDKADGPSLHATVTNISKGVTEFMPQEVALYQRGGPFSDDELRFLFVCELGGAKLRILGYFLEKKYGFDPREAPSVVIVCPKCGKKNSAPTSATRIRCGSCREDIPLIESQRHTSPHRTNIGIIQLVIAIAIVAAGMLVYAPWSRCVGGISSRTCYEQQVDNAASEYSRRRTTGSSGRFHLIGLSRPRQTIGSASIYQGAVNHMMWATG